MTERGKKLMHGLVTKDCLIWLADVLSLAKDGASDGQNGSQMHNW